ncbi:MAG: ribosome silencing factor [Armatimonadota bacterium]|nr:ribosome silencing factor [Armatimonadota bacterium]
MRRLTTDRKLKLITESAEAKKADNLQVLDLRERTLIADYFVVCSGGSNLHIKAIVDGILDALADHGMKHPRVEGYAESRWVLIDAGDVVAHIFARDEREFYDLESIWRGVEAALKEKSVIPSPCEGEGWGEGGS